MVTALLLLLAAALFGQQPQNPSPMSENRRPHTRLVKAEPPGRRENLSLGTLFLPAGVRPHTLLFFFHGGGWVPEVAAAQRKLAVAAIQIGAGSGVYSNAFAEPDRFLKLLLEIETKARGRFSRVILGGWSAGNGAIRTILRDPASYNRVAAVLSIDGIHTDYLAGKPNPDNLEIWKKFAQDAIAGRKRLLITHSEIYPGTYASTTETADWLARELGLRWRTILRGGPMGTEQFSEVHGGKLQIRGYVGNSAPDHVDQLHSLPEYLKWFRR